jgi:hypothetical protein
MEKETAAALLGAAVGGGLLIVANYLQERARTANRAEQLARAIAGEVTAVLRVVEVRGYLKEVKDRAQATREGRRQPFRISAQRNFFSTIEANLDSIGLLPGELPVLVPTLLTIGKAILEDFDVLRAMTQGQGTEIDLAARYDELAILLEAGIACGGRILRLVTEIYGAPHRGLPIWLRLRSLMRRLRHRLSRKP